MKIPTIDSPQVGPGAAPTVRPVMRQQSHDLEQGLGALSQGLGAPGRGVEDVAKEVGRQEKEAEELRQANSLASYQKDINTELFGDSTDKGRIDAAFDGRSDTRGFLSRQGTDASADSANVLDRLETKRQEYAEQLLPRQREEFLRRSVGLYEQGRVRVETHVSREIEVAKKSALEEAKQQALDSVATGGDPREYQHVVGNAFRSIEGLSVSKEDSALQKSEFTKSLVVTQISKQLGDGDVDSAAKQLELDKSALGDAYPKVKHQVDVALAGRVQDQAYAKASAAVTSWSKELENEDGFVTEKALRAKAADVPPEQQKFFDHALDRQVRLNAARLDEVVKGQGGARNAANAALAQGQPIPKPVADVLLKYDAEYYRGLLEDQRREGRAWKRDREGSQRDKTEARRAQMQLDKQYVDEWKTELIRNPTADRAEFLNKFILENGLDDDVTVSKNARARAGLDQASEQKRFTDGNDSARRQAASDFETRLRKMTRDGKKPLDEKEITNRLGQYLGEYDRWQERNGGKALDEKARDELENRAFKKVVADPGTKLGPFTFGKKEGLGIDQFKPGDSAPPPSAKKLSPAEQQALDWANSNPNDARAAAIKKKLGVN